MSMHTRGHTGVQLQHRPLEYVRYHPFEVKPNRSEGPATPTIHTAKRVTAAREPESDPQWSAVP